MQLKAIHSRFLNELRLMYEPHEASVITDMVFEEIAGACKSILITEPSRALPPEQVHNLEQALSQLKQHIPVQYVLGKAWFFMRQFLVTDAVLIPRPETEELVHAVLGFVKSLPGATVLDIGTGSGCIAISIKKSQPNLSVTAIDYSSAALEVARQNGKVHAADIAWQQLDFLKENNWDGLLSYDVIVSNPPYIPLREKDKLDKNVTQHEPAAALFVPDNDPLIFYRKIAGFAEKKLATGGKNFMEVHEDYAQEVAALFRSKHYHAEVLTDFYGKERIVIATRCL